jgi:hypothetical protein
MADKQPDTSKFHHDRQMWLLGATQAAGSESTEEGQ